jgi:hypothetical protein
MCRRPQRANLMRLQAAFASKFQVRARLHDLVISAPDQPHIRSPFVTAVPISRVRRVGAQEDEAILDDGFGAIVICGSSTWIRQN